MLVVEIILPCVADMFLTIEVVSMSLELFPVKRIKQYFLLKIVIKQLKSQLTKSHKCKLAGKEKNLKNLKQIYR